MSAETTFQELGAGLGDFRTAVDINNQNQVLIQAITNNSSEFCNFCYKTQYFITDGATTNEIPIPNQTANKYATGLNNNGSISGLTFLGPDDPSYDQNNTWLSKGFIWSNGQFTEYYAPQGFGSVSIRAINDSNVGAGTLNAPYLTNTSSAAIFENGEIHLLPHLSSKASTSADAINNNGIVAGTSMAEDGRRHAVIWENGVIRDLGVAGTTVYIKDINNSGKLVGTVGNRIVNSTSPRSITYEHNAFTWENGVINYLQAPEGSNSLDAFRVNNNGIVLGDFNGADGIPRDIMWDQSGAYTVIGYPIGEQYVVHVGSMNDNGIMVGQYWGLNDPDPGMNSRAFMFGDIAPQKPTNKNDCMKNGWKSYGFKNQGQCVTSVVKP